jgi:hypothetical protein
MFDPYAQHTTPIQPAVDWPAMLCGRSWRPSPNSSIIAAENAGMSSGLRLVDQLRHGAGLLECLARLDQLHLLHTLRGKHRDPLAIKRPATVPPPVGVDSPALATTRANAHS